MTVLSDTYSAIADVSVAFAPPPASMLAGLSDAELIAEQRRAAEVRRRTDAVSAALANEIATAPGESWAMRGSLPGSGRPTPRRWCRRSPARPRRRPGRW